MAPTVEIEAAGGLVLRLRGEKTQVLVVHRAKYDDWSLPKGKLDAGESFAEAALREVEEETGIRCRLGRELPTVRYRDQKGRRKVVRYWLMTPVAGRIEDRPPDDEISAIRWMALDQAPRLLSYLRDRELLKHAASAPVD